MHERFRASKVRERKERSRQFLSDRCYDISVDENEGGFEPNI